MKINKQTVRQLADLVKLEFDEQEEMAVEQDLQKITGFFQQISELDTENIEPLIHINEEFNVFRADKVEQLITKAEALKNAAVHDADYIKVPKMINK